MNNKQFINIFRQTGALLEGHFILTSGFHSPHYFQCAKVLQYPQYLTKFSRIIAKNFLNQDINVVISPAIGGIVLGTEVGRILNVRTIFAERVENKMSLRRGFEIFKGEKVLIVEDVITTGGSVKEIVKIIRKKKAIPAGVAFIVDRSNGLINFKIKQFSLCTFNAIKFEKNKIPDWLKRIPVTVPGSRKILQNQIKRF